MRGATAFVLRFAEMQWYAESKQHSYSWPKLALTVAAFASLVSGCSSCPREGCEALEEPASKYVNTGIKGSVASSSDVVVNGCQECPFSDAQLGIWVSETAVSGTIQRDALLRRAPDLMVFAQGRYTQALTTGHHMVCEAEAPCLGFDLASGDSLTINVKQRYGPTSFIVFDAAGQRLDEIKEFATLASD